MKNICEEFDVAESFSSNTYLTLIMSKEGVQTHLMAKGASSVIKRHERVSASPSPLFSVRKIQNLFRLSHA